MKHFPVYAVVNNIVFCKYEHHELVSFCSPKVKLDPMMRQNTFNCEETWFKKGKEIKSSIKRPILGLKSGQELNTLEKIFRNIFMSLNIYLENK